MGEKSTRGLIISITKVSSSLVKIHLRLSGGLKYHPGQWVRLALKSEQFGQGNIHSFQLCGCPTQALRTNHYEVLAETQFIPGFIKGLGRVQAGDLLWVAGPFGNFWPLSAKPRENLVWLATPATLGPFLACVQSANFEKSHSHKILLVIQVRQEGDLPWRTVFESKGITVIPCVEQPTHWVDGFWGSMVALLNNPTFKLDFTHSRFFLALENPLVNEVWQTLVENKRVPVSQLVMYVDKTEVSSSEKKNSSGMSKAA